MARWFQRAERISSAGSRQPHHHHREGHPHPVGGELGWSRRCHKGKIHLFGFAQRPLGRRGLEMGYIFSVFLLSLKSLYIELEEVTLKMRPRRALRRKDCVHSDCGSSDSRGLSTSAQVVKEWGAFPEGTDGTIRLHKEHKGIQTWPHSP